ncbi:uncharacterized protein VP01_2109g1 [Puccinia sorghi]|uniref:Uncharacterized protein n=1 Tax=Puccinia sorghi TaxID=27349 RepID=A0A0L6VBY8_9BASI|nr:uncharacterized protein VP01_2109g1 [Puccinia sorghi]
MILGVFCSSLPTTKFSHNNQDNTSTGISPFKENYGFNLSYGRVPLNNVFQWSKNTSKN